MEMRGIGDAVVSRARREDASWPQVQSLNIYRLLDVESACKLLTWSLLRSQSCSDNRQEAFMS